MKRIAAILLAFLMAGCATPQQQRWSAFNREVSENINNFPARAAARNIQPTDDIMFNDLMMVAEKYQQPEYDGIFRMLRNEALAKRMGLPNNYDTLRQRFDSGDTTLADDARTYNLNLVIQSKCSSFGYKIQTPEFNKCVHDLNVQVAQMKLQQMQMITQMIGQSYLPIAPPTPPQKQRFTCFQGSSFFTCQ